MVIENFELPDKFEDEDLQNCSCGSKPFIVDDEGSMKVSCEKCGKCTAEYLYGASSYHDVLEGMINDWNNQELNGNYWRS